MVTLVPKPATHVPVGEQRVIFRDLNWQKYQAILAAVGESRSARLTYDAGTLEITIPLEEHEQSSELIALFIRILVEELGLRMKSMGSTTLDYPGLNKGAEPDKGYYIQNYNQVAGRKVNLSQDPPPDLVVEVDITHTDIDKPRLYATMGVPEFWRYDGSVLCFFQRQPSGNYQEVERSRTFPDVSKEQFYQFFVEAQRDEVQASRSLRDWLQQRQHSR